MAAVPAIAPVAAGLAAASWEATAAAATAAAELPTGALQCSSSVCFPSRLHRLTAKCNSGFAAEQMKRQS